MSKADLDARRAARLADLDSNLATDAELDAPVLAAIETALAAAEAAAAQVVTLSATLIRRTTKAGGAFPVHVVNLERAAKNARTMVAALTAEAAENLSTK